MPQLVTTDVDDRAGWALNMRATLAALLGLFLLILLAPSAASQSVRLTGSGASFPYPIYSTWFKTFSRAEAGVIVDYQAKGSGAGIRDFINGTVDFAGSDAAMSDEELAQVPGGALMLPITAGAIVVAFNLPGVSGPLRLSREVYPLIFLGDISTWNDPRIAEANPTLQLPDLPITVVRRADSSGTTYAFSNHMSAVSTTWRDGPGVGKTVVWPDSDKIVAAPKNDGVAATILQTPGAIGYVELGYARYAKIPMAALENAAGAYVYPDLESGQSAISGAVLPDDLRIWIADPQPQGAYPIVTFSWLLLSLRNDSPDKTAVLRSLVEYCISDGQLLADRMGYIPLPAAVVDAIHSRLEQLQ